MYGYLFIKFSDEQFIDDMYDNEYLYFNSYSIFKQNMPEEKGRYDAREGNLKNIQIADLKLSIGGKELKYEKAPHFNAQFCEHLNDPKLVSCSLYSILLTEGINSIQIDERMREFGNKALMILDHNKFWSMLDFSLMGDDRWYKRDFLNLYDPKTYNGSLNYFDKDKYYSYLNEYRIMKHVPHSTPLRVLLPGLKEISVVADFDEVQEFTVTVKPTR